MELYVNTVLSLAGHRPHHTQSLGRGPGLESHSSLMTAPAASKQFAFKSRQLRPRSAQTVRQSSLNMYV